MSQKFEKLIEKAGSEYSLSSDERAKMTRMVREYMSYKPLPHAESYSISVSYRWFSFAHRPLAAALVLVLIFGSGVSYAAENALPGDTLYSIKTYVNEPARLALATNAEAKAEIQIELAERRINEAAVLAAEGRLDGDTQEELVVAFESHATAASENIEKTDETDSGAAVELASRFETRLAAHNEILTKVEIEDDAEHKLAGAVRGAGYIVASIRARAEERSAVSAPLEAELLTVKAEPSAETTEDSEKDAQTETDEQVSRFAAARMHAAADKKYEQMRKKVKSDTKVGAEARAEFEAQLAQAEEFIGIGEDMLAEGEIALAFHSFQDSLVITEKLDVMLEAAPTLAKANSRKGISGRDETRSARVRNDDASHARSGATTQATATIEITAPASIDIDMNGNVQVEAATETPKVLPSTIRIFPSDEEEKDGDGRKDESEDTHDSENGNSGNVKIDLEL